MGPFDDLVAIENNDGENFFYLNDQMVFYDDDISRKHGDVNRINSAPSSNEYLLFHIYIRPDVTDFSVMDLMEQVLISLGGGMVTKHGDLETQHLNNSEKSIDLYSNTSSNRIDAESTSTNANRANENNAKSSNNCVENDNFCYMEINAPSSKNPDNQLVWSSIKVYLGVNREKKRVLQVVMKSATRSGLAAQGIVGTPQLNTSVSNRSTGTTTATALRSTVANMFMMTTGENAQSAGGTAASGTETTGIYPTTDELLQLPQKTFHDSYLIMSKLFCLSLYEEYLTNAFVGVFLDNSRNIAWLQQYMTSVAVTPSNTAPSESNSPMGYRAPDEDVIYDIDEGDQSSVVHSGRPINTNGGVMNVQQLKPSHTTVRINSNELDAQLVPEYFISGVVNKYHNSCMIPPAVLRSILDINFVKDLQKSFGLDLKETLLVAADTLDTHVKHLEHSCAKLMTTLKVVYNRSGVKHPAPPESIPLSKYSLHLPSTLLSLSGMDESTKLAQNDEKLSSNTGISIIDATVETAKLLIYKARKYQLQMKEKFEHLIHSGNGHGTSSSTVQINYLDSEQCSRELLHLTTSVQELLHNVFTQLQAVAKDEALARMDRKILAISQRFRDVEKYKLQLILTLHNRTNSILGLNVLSGEDKAALTAFHSKFRFIKSEEEPLLFECGVTAKGRAGTLYVTGCHICYHSNYSLFEDTVQFAIPWKTIKEVQYGLLTVDSNGEVSQQLENASASTVLDLLNRFGTEFLNVPKQAPVIVLVDNSGNSLSMNISLVTPDYASRVFDLLVLLLQSKFYQIANSTDEAVKAQIIESHGLSQTDVMRTMRELTIQALSDRVVGANKTGDMMKKNRTKDLIAYSLISQYERYRVVEADAAVEALNRECESEVLKQSTSLVHTELIPNVTIDDVKDTRSMDADSVDLLGLCGNTEAGICSSSSHLKQPEIDVTSLLEWEESEVKGSTSCVAGDAVVKQPAIIIQPSDPPLVPVVPKPSKLQTNVQAFLQKSRTKPKSTPSPANNGTVSNAADKEPLLDLSEDFTV